MWEGGGRGADAGALGSPGPEEVCTGGQCRDPLAIGSALGSASWTCTPFVMSLRCLRSAQPWEKSKRKSEREGKRGMVQDQCRVEGSGDGAAAVR